MEGVRQLCAGRQRGTAPGASVAGSGRQERCPSVARLASQPLLRHCNRTSAWHAALVICPANSWNLIKAIFPTLLPCLCHSSCWTSSPVSLFILAFLDGTMVFTNAEKLWVSCSSCQLIETWCHPFFKVNTQDFFFYYLWGTFLIKKKIALFIMLYSFFTAQHTTANCNKYVSITDDGSRDLLETIEFGG